MIDARFYSACRPFTLKEIEAHLNTPITYLNSTPDSVIHGISSIENQVPETITFIADRKNFIDTPENAAFVCIAKQNDIPTDHSFKALILSDTPKHTFAKLAQLFYHDIHQMKINPATHDTWPDVQIDPTAIIDTSVEIGKGSKIGPYVTIYKGVRLGENCSIHNQVTLSHALICNDVIIHPGARIGQAGFGFAMDGAKPVDLPHLGRVIIENNVHIGSNTTIDRGFLADTYIGEGTRIDNLVQIAHNVRIGKGCVIIAQVGIAGSSEIGDGTILAGQSGVADHIKIGKNVIVAAQTGVTKSIPDKSIMGGSPAVPIMEWHRQSVILSKLARGKKECP